MSEYNRTMKNYYNGEGGNIGEGYLNEADSVNAPLGVYGPRPVSGGRHTRRRHARKRRQHLYSGGADGDTTLESNMSTGTGTSTSTDIGTGDLVNPLTSSENIEENKKIDITSILGDTTETSDAPLITEQDTTNLLDTKTVAEEMKNNGESNDVTIPDAPLLNSQYNKSMPADELTSTASTASITSTVSTEPEPSTTTSSLTALATPEPIVAQTQENGTTTVNISKEQMLKMFQRLDKNLYVYAHIANSIIEKYPSDVPEDVKTRITSIINIYNTASSSGALPPVETILKDESFTGLQSVETGLITLSMILATLLI